MLFTSTFECMLYNLTGLPECMFFSMTGLSSVQNTLKKKSEYNSFDSGEEAYEEHYAEYEVKTVLSQYLWMCLTNRWSTPNSLIWCTLKNMKFCDSKFWPSWDYVLLLWEIVSFIELSLVI